MEHFAVTAIFEELWLERIEEFLRILQWKKSKKRYAYTLISIFYLYFIPCIPAIQP